MQTILIVCSMSKQPEYPVLIPYSELCDLLDATRQIKQYKDQVKRLEDQVTALRIIQGQCMDEIRELKKLI